MEYTTSEGVVDSPFLEVAKQRLYGHLLGIL